VVEEEELDDDEIDRRRALARARHVALRVQLCSHTHAAPRCSMLQVREAEVPELADEDEGARKPP
jgi:hypothetical protein